MITLYGCSITRSIRCRWLLKELDLPYTGVEIDLSQGQHKKPEFLKINPFGKVPALVDDEITVTESAAICNYLAEKYSGDKMIPPAKTPARALYDQWMFFAMTELEQPLWAIVKHTFVYPKEKRIPQAIDRAVEDFKQAAAVLNAHLEANKMILGDAFTAVDVITGHTMAWADGYEVTKRFQLLAEFPHIKRYLSELKKRPAMPEDLREKIISA